MTKSRAALTELEGAILGVLRRKPGMTPYAVRKVFLGSRSEAWSGSAGAVYPAIARLARAGLLTSGRANDRRGTKTYRPSAAGARALDRWLCDAERARGIGLDPFRTRAALWALLPAGRRKTLFRTLARGIRAQRRAVASALPALEPADAAADRLLLALLDMRLEWLKTLA